jgi:uncharacterized cofD-like protein
MSPPRPIRFVAIGGGTGLSMLLSGLKPWLSAAVRPSVELTAIVTVTDDGKSSGRLRGEFGVLPPGDIRNCLVALAPEDALMTRLFRHRFPGGGEIGGHSLGNLMILALNQLSGDFLSAVDEARALLGIEARVLPSTLDRVDLIAQVNGQQVRGQVAIKAQFARIRQLDLVPPEARALEASIAAIRSADLITFGPGSLYTSVIANLLVPGISEALAASAATKIYICNLMTEADETAELSALDHVTELLRYGRGLRLDYALFNSAPISAEMRERYAAERATPLRSPELSACEGVRLIALPLAAEGRAVRHDPARLCEAIFATIDLTAQSTLILEGPSP